MGDESKRADKEHRAEWERREDEGEDAWVAFQAYRDMETPRSLRKLAELLGRNGHTGLGRNSSQFEWKRRLAAWDRELDRVRREGELKARVEAGRRHAREATKLTKVLLEPAEALIRRIQKRRAEDPDGDPFEALSDLELLKEVRQAARVYPVVGVFERLSLGMSTSNTGGHEGGPLEVVDHRRRVEQMPREEIDAYLLGVDAGRKAERDAPVETPDGE
jgi:hypothetical protein